MTMDGLKVTEEDKTFFATEFKLMDQNGDGLLDWWEFVNHESKMYLARRTKVFARSIHVIVCLFVCFVVSPIQNVFSHVRIEQTLPGISQYFGVLAYLSATAGFEPMTSRFGIRRSTARAPVSQTSGIGNHHYLILQHHRMSRLVENQQCGFRTGLTQTGLYSYRSRLEA